MRHVASWVIALMFCSLTSSAFALQINRMKIVTKAQPGEEIVEMFQATNSDKADVAVRVYTNDFSYIAPFDGEKNFFAPSTLPRSLAQYVDVQPKQVTVPAGGTVDFSLTCKMPYDFGSVKSGVIFIEMSLGKTFDETGKEVQVLNRVGVLLIIQPDGAVHQAEIKEVKADGNKFSFDLTNIGKTYVMPKVDYYVMTADGEVLHRGEFAQKYMFDGDTAHFESFVPESVSGTGLTLFMNVALGDDVSVAKEIVFDKDAGGAMTIKSVN